MEDLCFAVLEPESFVNMDEEVRSLCQKRDEKTKIRKTKMNSRYLKMNNDVKSDENSEVAAKSNTCSNANINKTNIIYKYLE